jgi:dihydroflavonol-4-reductase
MSSIVTVTGASGHIGAFIVRGLLAQGRRVRAVYLGDAPALEGLDVEHVRADVTDRQVIGRAIQGSEVVYHLAALISLHERDAALMRRVNVDGVRNVVDACVEHGVRRLIHFSSIHAYQPRPPGETLDETCPLALGKHVDLPSYDRSKAEGTQRVHEGITRGLEAVLLHPVGVLGPADFKPSQIGDGLLKIANRQLPALIEGGFTWVDARDVATTALAAETRGRSGEHYLLGGPWVSVTEMGEMVYRAIGVRPPRLVTPMWVARMSLPFVRAASWLLGMDTPYNFASLHAIRTHRLVSYEKAVRELGHKVRPTQESVTDTMRWFQQRGKIRFAPESLPSVGESAESAVGG